MSTQVFAGGERGEILRTKRRRAGSRALPRIRASGTEA